MRHYQLDELGLSSWLELYHQLEKGDMLGDKTVILNWPANDHSTIEISVCYVKAQAFDEIYHKLPLKVSVMVIQDLLVDLDENKDNQLKIMQFLNKIPTRAK